MPTSEQVVLARLDELVVKPVDGYGGMGVVIGPQATDEELAEARALITEQPARWIAQETVRLSTHPTFDERARTFRPRHVDLRVFVYYGAQPGRRARGAHARGPGGQHGRELVARRRRQGHLAAAMTNDDDEE